MGTPQLSVIVSTYRSPRSLRLCLHALAADLPGVPPVELLVGDDGDDDHQSRLPVEEAASWGAFSSVRRFWQRHDGFGKCRLANKGAAAATAPLLFYLDGDCLVAPGTLRAHCKLARSDRYVAGSAVRLGPRASLNLDEDAVRAGRHASPTWIAHWALLGDVEAKAHYPALRSLGPAARLFRHEGRGGFNGGCSSVPAAVLRKVNGWDESFGCYGFEDTDLGHRLQNSGIVPVDARVEAMVVHLWHERPYRGDDTALQRNWETIAGSLHGDKIRAQRGLAELGADDPAVWDDFY